MTIAASNENSGGMLGQPSSGQDVGNRSASGQNGNSSDSNANENSNSDSCQTGNPVGQKKTKNSKSKTQQKKNASAAAGNKRSRKQANLGNESDLKDLVHPGTKADSLTVIPIKSEMMVKDAQD